MQTSPLNMERILTVVAAAVAVVVVVATAIDILEIAAKIKFLNEMKGNRHQRSKPMYNWGGGLKKIINVRETRRCQDRHIK